MSKILVPPDPFLSISSISEFLDAINGWYIKHNIPAENRSLSAVWYRGMSVVRPDPLLPGVYREEFSKISVSMAGNDSEEKRLNLEREMFDEFRTTEAQYFKADRLTEAYFTAQHFGMPTRLLDWTTNPLAALFFAVENEKQHLQDGEVFIMQASRTLADYFGRAVAIPVISMRHSLIRQAIKEIVDGVKDQKGKFLPSVFPVRPDNQPGRIGQQSSCFTLHMPRSKECQNPTLDRIAISAKGGIKAELLKELRRLNINEFTIYNDLDHLSRYIKRAWGLARDLHTIQAKKVSSRTSRNQN